MKSLMLENKVILVTGASGHLGSAIAMQLAYAGAHLFINGRNEEKLQTLAATIRSGGGNATPLQGDIASEEDHNRIALTIEQSSGRLDGLVNNAYSGVVGTIESTTVAQMRDSLDMSVASPFFLTRRLLPLLRKSSGPSIVNICSMYGMISPDGRIYGDSGSNSPPFYGAGKAALLQLTRYLACHLAEENIRVNAISPGAFPPQSIKTNKPEFHAKLADKIPMGRIGVADEVGGAVQFLLSDSASYITGVNLPVDGGWTAGSN